jgi:DeoR family transcriptional regulator, myo-inositol catabolism operon repressor
MKAKRLNQLEEYLEEKQEASLEELKDHFQVSLNTIRRDINELVQTNVIKKVYGGVVYNKSGSATTAYEERNITSLDEKKRIGHYCSKYIEENDIVFIDSGTTTHFILDLLPEAITFTLITNSLEVINKAVVYPNIHLILIGETYKRSTKSFTGIDDDKTITKFNINKAFMSATAFSITNGASNSDILENRIKTIVCERADEVYLLIDSSKFGKNSLFTYSKLEDLKTIITDKSIDAAYADQLQQAAISIVTL